MVTFQYTFFYQMLIKQVNFFSFGEKTGNRDKNILFTRKKALIMQCKQLCPVEFLQQIYTKFFLHGLNDSGFSSFDKRVAIFSFSKKRVLLNGICLNTITLLFTLWKSGRCASVDSQKKPYYKSWRHRVRILRVNLSPIQHKEHFFREVRILIWTTGRYLFCG